KLFYKQNNFIFPFNLFNLLIVVLFYLNRCVKITINQYTTAVLANHDLFVLAYLTLFLRRDSIKATTTCISFYLYNSQSIPIAVTDLGVAGQQAGINRFFCFSSLLIKMLFFFFSRANDLFQLFLLRI